jgi:hypothetical protein
MSGERPHFDREGRPPDPDDPYTQESVRTALSQLYGKLNAGESALEKVSGGFGRPISS